MSFYLKTTLMRKVSIVISLFVFIFLPAAAQADSFSVEKQQEMHLYSEALDITVSSDGQWTFVLTRSGVVSIYSASGNLIQSIKVGKGFDSIEYSAAGNRLLLGGSGEKVVKILSLSMIYELDYRDSPFMGTDNAMVTIAAFDDFQ
ncbi:MAG: hypothetical protein PVJ01_04835 [Pseudomonadota bacterium]